MHVHGMHACHKSPTKRVIYLFFLKKFTYMVTYERTHFFEGFFSLNYNSLIMNICNVKFIIIMIDLF